MEKDENARNYWVDVEIEDKFDMSLLQKEGLYKKTDLSERGVQSFVRQL